MKSDARTKPRLAMTIQTKVLALVLVPLFMATTILVTKAALVSQEKTEALLEEQRASLMENRQAAVQDVVRTAVSSIQPIVEDDGLTPQQAKRRAADALRSVAFGENNYLFVYDAQGINVASRLNPENEGVNMLAAKDANGKPLVSDMLEVAQSGGGFYDYTWEHPVSSQPSPKVSYVMSIPEWDWMVGAGVYTTDIDAAMADAQAVATAGLRQSVITDIVFGVVMFAVVALLALVLVRRTVRPIRVTADAMRDIAHGKGDLTKRLQVTSHDELGELSIEFNAFVSRMQDTLQEVRANSNKVFSASGEIAEGSQELASRTEQAAANLQETSSSMEQISANVAHAADGAKQGESLARSAATVAEEGHGAMQQVETTMTDIAKSGSQIRDIITLIDGIAFQTNILALNASVEAARAGEHGRGFAVVASEVRTLASRSADASKEIRTLIDESTTHTDTGTQLVAGAGEKIREIVESVSQMAGVMTEISAGASEQSSGITQINTAVSEMDAMTQQNASMVQQTSTAAADLRRHAGKLNELVGSFILGESEEPQAGRESRTQTTPATRVTRPSQAAPSTPRSEDVAEWESF